MKEQKTWDCEITVKTTIHLDVKATSKKEAFKLAEEKLNSVPISEIVNMIEDVDDCKVTDAIELTWDEH